MAGGDSVHATIRWPATPAHHALALAVADTNDAAELEPEGKTVAVRSPEPILVRASQVESLLGLQAGSWRWEELLANRVGALVVESGGRVARVIPPGERRGTERGWHIVVPREVHDRWHRAAQALGLSKKAFTTLCIEHYIQQHMPDEDRKARWESARAGLAELLKGILSG